MRVRRLRKYIKPSTGELITFESKQYYVTDEGLVYDGDRHRYVAQCENHYGYMTVSLMDDSGKRHTSFGVHCLVATCFQRLLERGEQVHHRNHDRNDNNLSNLVIIDGGEHSRQHNFEKWKDGRFKTKNVGNNYRPAKQVVQLSLDGILVKVWPSANEAGRNGYNCSTVAHCCRGERKKHKGYRWQYLEDYRAQQSVSQQVQIELAN